MPNQETFPPESVRSAIAELWRASHQDEQRASRSAAFRLLKQNCEAAYLAIEGSRLQRSPFNALQPTELQSLLLRFFRWCGAPWHDSNCLTVEDAALRLHRAFLTKHIDRVYLVPLDQLDLEPPPNSPLRAPENIRFGPNELRRMTSTDLHRLVPIDGINRFGPQYAFPVDQLDGLCWLVVTAHEDAGPLWKRTPLRWFHEATYGAIGETRLYQPIYPAPVEDALFVLLLAFVNEPTEAHWRPFMVPWIYSFTDDPFAEPQRAPDLSALTWTVVGEPGGEALVPDKLWPFQITEQALDEFRRRQLEFETVSAGSSTSDPGFGPLTQHFFVKALAMHGIDEIIANLSCLEATLKKERPTRPMKDRFEQLTGKKDARQWIDSGYDFRNRFLHGFGQFGDNVHSRDLARIRWCVSQAVREYLSFASKHSDRSRGDLLDMLSPRD